MFHVEHSQNQKHKTKKKVMKKETSNVIAEKSNSVPPVLGRRKLRRNWTFSAQMWETFRSDTSVRMPFVYSYTQRFICPVPREYALPGFLGHARLFAERHSFTFNEDEVC